MSGNLSVNRHAEARARLAVEIAELARREKDSEPAADPILDRLPQQRGKRAAKSVLRILDNLDQEGSR